MFKAVKNGNIDKVDELGYTVLMWASCHGRLDIVKLLLRNGADVNIIHRDGWTALIYVSYIGYLEIVKALLSRGADVNIIDKCGRTTLMCAVDCGDLKIVKIKYERELENEKYKFIKELCGLSFGQYLKIEILF